VSARDNEGGHVGPPLRARLILLYINAHTYILGIQAADGAYIPIGKVDSLADLHPDERAKLRKRARALVTESFGPTSLLKPEIVVEATYSHIDINNRTKAGKVLRNVAITRICWDDSIESIAALESL
jgi:ATP-dependent DNA ligase